MALSSNLVMRIDAALGQDACNELVTSINAAATSASPTFTGTVTTSALTANGTLTIGDANNIVFGTSTGTQIGTATTQRLAFYGSTPVVKATVTGAKGSNAALGSLMTALAALGLVVDSTSA